MGTVTITIEVEDHAEGEVLGIVNRFLDAGDLQKAIRGDQECMCSETRDDEDPDPDCSYCSGTGLLDGIEVMSALAAITTPKPLYLVFSKLCESCDGDGEMTLHDVRLLSEDPSPGTIVGGKKLAKCERVYEMRLTVDGDPVDLDSSNEVET